MLSSSKFVLNIWPRFSSWNQSRCIFNSSFTCFFVGSAARSGVTQVDFYTRFIYKFCSSSSIQAYANLILCCKKTSLWRFCVHVGSRWDDKGILNDPFFGRNVSISLSDLLHNWEVILKWVSPLFFPILFFSFSFSSEELAETSIAQKKMLTLICCLVVGAYLLRPLEGGTSS